MNNEGLTRILVPLDGSARAEQAIPFAAALAQATTEIVFLTVTKHSAGPNTPLTEMEVADPTNNRVMDVEANALLQEAYDRWRDVLPGTPKLLVVVGDPAAEIVAAADRTQADLIVAASHGRGALKRLAFGSVADELARNSHVPVMLMRASDEPAERKAAKITGIVIPFDGSELSHLSFPIAIKLARATSATVHVVDVVEPMAITPPPTMMEPVYPAEVVEDLIDDAQTSGKIVLGTAQQEFEAAGLTVDTELATGSVAEIIEAKSAPGNIVVLATHARGGVHRWLMGSTAETLVREGPVPVVIVRKLD